MSKLAVRDERYMQMSSDDKQEPRRVADAEGWTLTSGRGRINAD